MSRPTRNETLEALDHVDMLYDAEHKNWWHGMRHAVGVTMGAAQAYAAMAPDTCPRCDGVGNRAPDAVGGCANCAGRGYVWPDTLIARVADKMKAQFDSGAYGEIPDYKWRVLADTVVGALVEVDDDDSAL